MRPIARCSEQGCDNIVCARGLCSKHYERRREMGALPRIVHRESRSAQVHIYMTETEKQALIEAAREHGETMSVYAAKIVRWYLKKQRQRAATQGGEP